MILIMLIGFVFIILFLNKFKSANRGQPLNVIDIIGLVHGAICQQGKYNLSKMRLVFNNSFLI